MQRRMLLLFALFVVTAWFYSSMAQNSTEATAGKHQKQIQMLEEADEVLSRAGQSGTENLGKR